MVDDEELARRIAFILGESSAAGQAVAELDRRRGAGEMVSILQSAAKLDRWPERRHDRRVGMSRLQRFLLRWIAGSLVPNNGTHVLMEVIAREVASTFYEDNWRTVEDYLHERLAVGVHNAMRAPSSS